MNHSKITVVLFLLTGAHHLSAQVTEPDTTRIKSISLGEIVISVNKTEETKRTVAQQVETLTAEEIASSQAQTTADLIAGTGSVMVQKSQQGGGSPVIRGFEASRILLVIDGVRMNNIIYRAGHLQNIISLDNAILDRAEILFGPSSTIYGSDALGGVIHFYTKKPLLATDSIKNFKVNAMTRFGSVNNEFTGHVDFIIGGKKLALLTSLTYSTFGDLRGGENQNPFYDGSYGERPYYAQRFGNTDSLVKNDDRYLQVQSGYSQYDLLQKFLLKQSEHTTHGLNIQYSNSTDVPRYDRLTDPAGSGLAFSEWYYGPQKRLLAAYDAEIKNSSSKFQNIRAGINFQDIEESRHTRNFGSSTITHRTENVNVFGADVDFHRIIKSHSIRLGVEAQYNKLKSKAEKENIISAEVTPARTRYPDGDNTMLNTAIYFSHTWHINDKVVLTDGIRLGYSSLHSTLVDTAIQLHLPYTDITQNSPVYSGSIGLVHSPSEDWKLSLLFSTGFRVPNVDDLSKVFESEPGVLIVPNNNLKPEKTFNYEFGVTKVFEGKTRWENALYYTRFADAIVTDVFTFNGNDSVDYNGSSSVVKANQNKSRAYLYGISSNIKSQCSENFLLTFALNYTYGRIKTDSSDYPLDHIPPFMMRLALNYSQKKFGSEFFISYNGWKKMKDYNLGGEDNDQYATAEGMPAWFTVNFRTSYKVHKLVTLQAGVDNIFDTQYRSFASGINAPGRNIFAALRFKY